MYVEGESSQIFVIVTAFLDKHVCHIFVMEHHVWGKRWFRFGRLFIEMTEKIIYVEKVVWILCTNLSHTE
jgi:hypothetical protein